MNINSPKIKERLLFDEGLLKTKFASKTIHQNFYTPFETLKAFLETG